MWPAWFLNKLVGQVIPYLNTLNSLQPTILMIVCAMVNFLTKIPLHVTRLNMCFTFRTKLQQETDFSLIFSFTCKPWVLQVIFSNGDLMSYQSSYNEIATFQIEWHQRWISFNISSYILSSTMASVCKGPKGSHPQWSKPNYTISLVIRTVQHQISSGTQADTLWLSSVPSQEVTEYIVCVGILYGVCTVWYQKPPRI